VLAMTVAMLPALAGTGSRLRWLWNPRHPAIATVLRLSGWTAGFVVANQIALFIVIALANRHSGGPTAYSYAYWFFILPHGIFAVSVMSAVEPEMASAWQDDDTDAVRNHLIGAIKLVAALAVPAACAYAVLGRPIVRLLLEHGSFSLSAARTTADVLSVMALGLPGFSLYLLLMRAYQAIQDTRAMFLTYLVENGLNVLFAFVLYPRWGVQGLAAALALGYAGGCAVALLDMRRRLGDLRGGRLGLTLYRITVAAVVTADVALAVSVVMANIFGTARGGVLLFRVVAAVIAGVTVYVRVARYFGVDEVRTLLQPRRRPAS
jgi:putative peptidoglycan lipid II flippase